MLRFSITLVIKTYQRFVSPRKGFVCAHHALHGKGGCSSRILVHVQEEPVSQWWRLSRREFRACKSAATTLRDKKRKRGCDPSDTCDVGECFDW
jgi:putative component of membrane protein insertase Oxa1/YidC/SpoIIIJ protein YidD